MVDAEVSSASSTDAILAAGSDATSDDSRVLDKWRGTPKVKAFSEASERSQNLKPIDEATVSCHDYLRVPVSKARPCRLETTTDSQTSERQLSEPKAQTALAVQTPGGHQKANRLVADSSTDSSRPRPHGLPLVGPGLLKHNSISPIRPGANERLQEVGNAVHSIEDCPLSSELRKTDVGEATATATGLETSDAEVMLDAGQTEQSITSPVSQDESDGASNLGNRQGRSPSGPLNSSRCGHQNLASQKPTWNPVHDASAPMVLHSPIPVSKMRPFVDPSMSTYNHGNGNQGHSSVSKLRPAHDAINRKLSLDEQSGAVNSAEPKPAPSCTSDSNQASGFLFDHKRTRQWLKDVLKYPENYTSQYTRRPGNTNRISNTSLEQARRAESVLSCPLPSRYHTKPTPPPEKPSSGFDRLGFKRAVSDLERLLSEALAIASQVVDQPGSTASREPYKQPSISLHSHCRSMPSQIGAMRGPRLLPCSASADGSGGDYLDPIAPTIGSHLETTANTPLSKSRSLPSQSKMQGPLQPGQQKAVESIHESTVHGEVGDGFHIPRRKSSKKLGKLSFEHETRADAEPQPSAPNPLVHGRVLGSGLTQPYNVQSRNLRHTGRRVIRSDYGVQGTGGADEAKVPPNRNATVRPPHMDHGISLRRRSHVSLRGAQGFSLAKSHKRQPVARDWSPFRKRFVASVACISTALIGIILGIYSGLVPSIQYYVIDQSHVIVHGNTACFLGLAIPTFFLWPLPLLHGRKPYILSSLVLAMPLLFPQALAVNSQRLTDAVAWKSFLLAARALMGVSLGFASMNFHSILTDLFGASLMSCNPHQEVVDRYDARRHGGGMGVWLGIWTWCWIGSLGVGFLMGACIIDSYNPEWGFYASIIVIAFVLILNVVCPEVRRSPYRRSVVEVRTGEDISRRVARGEVMMHRVKTGPRWWGQEVYHGIALNLEMLRQPGFAVLAIYSAWIYAQVVLIIILHGSLLSRFYRRRSTEVGLLVGVMALGALLAIPFQKASWFSRSRQAQLNSNLATLNRKIAWSSHLVRRTVFTLLLPLAGICYAAVSSGPPIHVSIPTIFSGFVGFLSCLAISECNGLVMEAFDCSDLSPAMTGRQKDGSGKTHKRINYSSFPRVTAGFASIHSFAFVLAAASTALGGHVTRRLGQRVSTGVVAGILLVLTVLLLLVLIRFVEVQIVPKSKSEEMDRLVDARRRSTIRRASMPGDAQAVIEEEEAWRPAMIGNPTSRTRRMNIFEFGGKTRWQEIRAKNKLIDAGAHLNREAWDQGLGALDDQLSDFRRDAHVFFHGKKRSNRKLRETGSSNERGEPIEMRDFEHEHGGRTPAESGWRGRRDCALSRSPG
ncbi:hypothetical protein E4U41_004002 [Claviceps citrina]|nr:hypothetical protein E4U41_004002 [Claviceps citrina]